MIRPLIFILILLKGNVVSASMPEEREWIDHVAGNCFTAHLREAVKVNGIRKMIYSSLTKGASRRLSNQLIALDRIGIFVAHIYDSRSQAILGRTGVPVLCEVIPSMLPVLGRPLVIGKEVPLADFEPFSASKANREIMRSYRIGGLPLAQKKLGTLKKELERNPRFNCLARQFIRSMERMAEVAQNTPSEGAEALSWDMLKLTLLQLRILVQLDREAAPFQANGIPILCAESPDLPAWNLP